MSAEVLMATPCTNSVLGQVLMMMFITIIARD